MCIENAYRACLERRNSIIGARYVFDVIVLDLESSPILKGSLSVLWKIKVVIIPCQMICLGRRIIADKLVGARSNGPATNSSVKRVRPPVCIGNTRQHVGGNDWCSENILHEVRVGTRKSEPYSVRVHNCYTAFSTDYALAERLIVRRQTVILKRVNCEFHIRLIERNTIMPCHPRTQRYSPSLLI